MENWQLNQSLIPSIAVVLNSVNRMALGLTDEINLRLSANMELYQVILPLKVMQLKRLSLAIIVMYVALALLVLNALLEALEIVQYPNDKALILISISLFLGGIFLKIQFSYNAYKIRQKQFNGFVK